MKNILLLLIFTAILAPACKTQRGASTTSTDLTDTRWTYKDDDMTYEITFKKNGVLKTTHPNDVTPNNDTWEQSGDNVTFWYNDKYSTYKGKRNGNTITGTGKNTNESWKFTMTLIK